MTETDDDVLTLSGLQKVIYDCISKNRENNSSDTQSLISLASLKNKKGKRKFLKLQRQGFVEHCNI